MCAGRQQGQGNEAQWRGGSLPGLKFSTMTSLRIASRFRILPRWSVSRARTGRRRNEGVLCTTELHCGLPKLHSFSTRAAIVQYLLLSLFFAQVNGHAFLVASDASPPRTDAINVEFPPDANGIADTRWFNFNDLGTVMAGR